MPPVNDNVASRRVISGNSGTDGAITIDTATTEAGEPHGVHVGGIHESIWYEWTPAASVTVVFDTGLSPSTDGNADSFGHLDTTLAVWTASNPASFATFTEVTSNDDNPDTGGGDFTSKVQFIAVAGTTYLIQVGTFAAGYAGAVVLRWAAVAGVSSSDCLDASSDIVADITGSDTPGTTTGDDFTAPHDSNVFGGRFYGCWELDVGDPNTGPYYQYWVGSCALDGSGFASHELNGFATHDLHDNGAAETSSVGTIPGGTAHTAGGGFGSVDNSGGRMRLVYDGTNVFLIAVNTLIVRNPDDTCAADATGDYSPVADRNAIKYQLRVYREDSGSWTEISVVETLPSTDLDGFAGYRVCASDAEPGVLYLGVMYSRRQLVKNALCATVSDTLFDYFERWSIDTSTGAETLIDRAASSIDKATFDGGSSFDSVGTIVWDIVNDDGHPILLRCKASTIDPSSSPERTGYDSFVTVERFDTAAAITTFGYPDVSGETGAHPVFLPANDSRESVTLRVYPRFFCSETGQYERFFNSSWDMGGGAPSQNFLARVASGFTSVPEEIAPESAIQPSNEVTWEGVTTPLYDGARNVFQNAAVAGAGDVHMHQYDRRCLHGWERSSMINLVTAFQYGGWDTGSFYSLGFPAHGDPWPIIKFGPIVRDCLLCEGGPLGGASGLFAWVRV